MPLGWNIFKSVLHWRTLPKTRARRQLQNTVHFSRILIILHSLVCSKWDFSWTHRSPYGDVSARATLAPQISPFRAPPTHTCAHILGIQPAADAHCSSISHITSLLGRVPSIIPRLINERLSNRGVGGWLRNYRHNRNNNQGGAANRSSK